MFLIENLDLSTNNDTSTLLSINSGSEATFNTKSLTKCPPLLTKMEKSISKASMDKEEVAHHAQADLSSGQTKASKAEKGKDPIKVAQGCSADQPNYLSSPLQVQYNRLAI
jgi:hypothetical protein